jgi:hypothetical protein
MIRTTVAAALAGLATAACANMAASDDGWVDLLANGLDGMEQVGGAEWSFADGVAQASSGSGVGWLLTPDDYTDFELSVEFYVSEEHNSGVFFRCSNRAEINDRNCYEANVFDNRPDQSGRTGGIPNYGPPMAVIDAAGQWNTYLIRAEGDHIEVTLNGVKTVDIRDSTMSAGPLGLQWGTGTVMFRNVRARRL